MGVLLAKVLAIAVLVSGPCPNPPGPVTPVACAVAPATIYLTPWATKGVLNHELGHLVDYNLLTDADRGRFRAYALLPSSILVHRPRVTWRTGDDFAFAEQFAEAFRMCVHSTRYPTRQIAGWAPTTSVHRRVCRWLASIGARP